MASQRTLAVVMFTDIVGYSALMGKDSAKAMELLRVSKQIQKPLVETHNGKWLKEIGDGAMIQFSTALDAVNCAVEIQRASRADFEADFRIGIHLGDITIEAGDIYGDGVNVAARLESVADPGGIYISESVEKAIRGQTNIQAKYIGELDLKNVNYGVRTYALQGIGLPIPSIKEDKPLSGRFWAEVRRRGVLRAGITYILVALLLMVLSNEAETLPQWLLPALVAVLIIGLPIALYLAWNYERSPAGFVRTTSKESWQNPYRDAKRKPFTSNLIMGVLVLIIVTIYVYPRYISLNDSAITDITDKSIAVLPFYDMSPERNQEYFSDGMMDEILNHLYKIGGLKVPSRTTSMRYKGITDKTIQEIGNELGVAHVLEGSVRKQGNDVRLTVQLIDVQSDDHLWSKSYDRELKDVFAIQSEVAQHIAHALKAEISPEVKQRIETIPTKKMEAYDLLLEARYHILLGDFEKGKVLLDATILLDTSFAEAYSLMGFYWLVRGSWGGDLKREDVLFHALPLLNKAQEINPDYPITYMYLSFIHLWFEWDFKAAEKTWRALFRLSPSNSEWVWAYCDFLNASGRFKEAVEIAELAVLNDPGSWNNASAMALSYYFNDQPEQSIQYSDRMINIITGNLIMDFGRVYIYIGKYHDAINLLEDYTNSGNRYPRPLGNLGIAYYHTNQQEKIDNILTELKHMSEQSPVGSPSFYIAMIYAQMREIEQAFQWLEKAYQDHEVEIYWLKVEPPFEPLHGDPRWQEMLYKVGFPD